MNKSFASMKSDRSTELRPAPWATVLWNDPLNSDRYVTQVLRWHFGYSADQAGQMVTEIATSGRGIVSLGVRERVEADVLALHSYGLRATMEMNLKTDEQE